ncbi:MAG: hypothetical protein ACT4N2_06475 [Hyphomicrobium sp.]
MKKLKEWTRRYLPSEIIATATTLSGAYGASLVTDNAVAIAYAGTWGENVGYYSAAAIREMRAQNLDETTRRRRPLAKLKCAACNLMLEFGAAEMIDTFVSRPFFMVLGPSLTGHLGAGIVAGKIAADIVFYAIAIICYELRKNREALSARSRS